MADTVEGLLQFIQDPNRAAEKLQKLANEQERLAQMQTDYETLAAQLHAQQEAIRREQTELNEARKAGEKQTNILALETAKLNKAQAQLAQGQAALQQETLALKDRTTELEAATQTLNTRAAEVAEAQAQAEKTQAAADAAHSKWNKLLELVRTTVGDA